MLKIVFLYMGPRFYYSSTVVQITEPVMLGNISRPVHPPYFSVICTDCKANYEIPPITSKLRIRKSRKYEKSQSGFEDWVGKQT